MFDFFKWGRAALAAALLVSATAAQADGPVWESTSGGSAAVVDTNLVANDVSGFQTVTVQFTSVGSGNVVTFAGSNDGTTYITLPGITTAGAVHTGVVTPVTTTAWIVPLTHKYFRARVTTYSSGTVTALVTYKNAPTPSLAAIGGTTVVGGNVASGATDSGNPVKVGGVYNSTKPTLANGQRGDLNLGSRGSLHVSLLANDSGTALAALADNADGVAVNANTAALSAASRNNVFNGTTWDREFTCPSSAVINVAAAATTQLVALQSSQIIRVCSFVISGDTAATTATFVYGTGSNCATGQVSLTGAMRMVDEGNISSTGMNGSLFRTIASNALCLTAATGAVTGFVTYAQY